MLRINAVDRLPPRRAASPLDGEEDIDARHHADVPRGSAVAFVCPQVVATSALNEPRVDATRNACRLRRLFEGNAKAEQNQVDRTIVAGKSNGGSVTQIADDVCDHLRRFENVEKGIEVLVLDAPNSIHFSVAGSKELYVI
jgi:hypothetical protein